jgi:hypothetical protein
MREKLIELIENAPVWRSASFDEACTQLADHLFTETVTVVGKSTCGKGRTVTHE